MIFKITLTGSDRQLLYNLNENNWILFLFGTPANETDVEVNVSDSIITIRFVVEETVENVPYRLNVTKDDGDTIIRCDCFTGGIHREEIVKLSDLPYKPQPEPKEPSWFETGRFSRIDYQEWLREKEKRMEERRHEIRAADLWAAYGGELHLFKALKDREENAGAAPLTYQEWLISRAKVDNELNKIVYEDYLRDTKNE